MEIEEAKEIILTWDGLLSIKEKKYIHLRSMKNFAFHLSDIRDPRMQDKIRILINEYINEIKLTNFEIEPDSSYYFATKYLRPLSEYYRDNVHFVKIFQINAVITYGLMGDILLYLSKLLSKIEPIPVITICFLLYYIFVKIFKEQKGQVYGYYY